MSNVAIELSPAELELIEAKRAEKQAAEDKRAAEEAIRQERREKEAAAHAAAVESMIAKLRKVDTKDLLFRTEENGPIKFMLNGREYAVRIEEHRVSYNSGWRSRSAGLKYKLDNEYNNRYLTNPKTVIKKIVELQEAVRAKAKRADTQANLTLDAQAALEGLYPNADIAHQDAYNYGGRYGQPRRSQPNHFTVTTPNGTVEFTYSRNEDDGVDFGIRARRPSQLVADEVTKLILG